MIFAMHANWQQNISVGNWHTPRNPPKQISDDMPAESDNQEINFEGVI